MVPVDYVLAVAAAGVTIMISPNDDVPILLIVTHIGVLIPPLALAMIIA